MKKILLAFDGSHFSEGTLAFVRSLNDKNPILLTAAFLPQVDFANLWSFTGAGPGGTSIPIVQTRDAPEIKKNIRRFELYCQKNIIEYRIHKTFFDFALPELKNETRFADLLVISSETFYEQAGTETPNGYLQEALHDAECPVIIVPENFEFPKSNILTYDGSGASVYAIKQFAYVMNELAGNETMLVYAKDDNEELLPEQANIEELVARHFPKLSLLRLEANPKKYFSTWLNEKDGAMVVSGAFGRSSISRSFRKSFITDIISEHRLPLFIAHR